MTPPRPFLPRRAAVACLLALLGAHAFAPRVGAAQGEPPQGAPPATIRSAVPSPWDGAPFPPPGDSMTSLARSGRWTEALSLYRLQLLRGHLEKERWEEALQLLERMERSRDFPRVADPGELRGTLSASLERDAVALARQGLLDDALSLADLSVRFAPGRAGPRTLLAWCRRGLGAEDAAEGDYRVAVSIDPRHFPALAGLARLLEDGGRSGEAAALWSRFLEREPSNAEAWLHRADSLLRAGNPGGAARDLEQACALGSGEGCRRRDEIRGSLAPPGER